MPLAWSSLVLAVPLGFLALTYALRAHAEVVGPLRLAAVRAALVTGAYAVLVVEVLGTQDRLTAPAFGLAWLFFLVGASALAWWRWRRDRWWPNVRLGDRWRTASRGERFMAGTVGGLLLAELLIALLAEPNNFDSQTYHLPKVERWAAQGNLDFWPTAIHRQVTIPPGAEYLLLHLRLLTGGDMLYNLVQWLAGVGAVLVVTRIVAQLGGGRRAQLLAAFLLATTPMVTLQATSTQTDLVVAAWVGCVATLVLDGLSRRASVDAVLGLGAATGLTAVTKTSGLLGVGPLLVLWGLAQLRLALTVRPVGSAATPSASAAAPSRPTGGRRRLARSLRVVGASLAVLAVAAIITGPFVARITAEFGHPLGPPRLRESIPMQRHDPGSVLVNGLRIAHTALDTPLTPLRDVTAAAIIGVADVIGVDPQDRAITFGRTTFPVRSWYPDEDRVAFPIAGTVMLVAGAVALIRPRRVAPERQATVRAYAAAVTAAVLLYCVMIKWQPWGNRLLLFTLVLAAPMAGLWLNEVLARRPASRRSLAFGTVVVVLATSALAGVLAVSYGFPRRLVGTGSLLIADEWETRFLRRPEWAAEFRWAAEAVRDAGARRVGLVQQNDNWEYPWWLLLRSDGAEDAGPMEIVALQSVLPSRPPADPATVDAIVCTGSQSACQQLVPSGWRVEFRDYVGYALPPEDSPR